MTTTSKLQWIIATVLGTALNANATQPPDPVESDSHYNTAVGSYAIYNESTGRLNTAIGYEALYDSTTGSYNTALGASALLANTTGSYNTASGNYALHLNTIGTENTSSGYYSMYHNEAGYLNTATGFFALTANTDGFSNVADGASALYSNTTGYDNVASGIASMYSHTSGYDNTAIGARSLFSDTGGVQNTALGSESMFENTIGYLNTAVGTEALYGNTSGGANVGVGQGALYANTTGSDNVAIGSGAGESITGSNNVDIAAPGESGENGVIRIGTPGTQKSAFIAGISGSKLTGSAVYVNSAGQLGVLASSERYKTAIKSMGNDTAKLDRLRPVTFHLKNDPGGVIQYGLIAEEVVKVYPELVIRDQTGKIQGVRYEELSPMLLNEVQQLKTKLRDINQEVAELHQQNELMQAALSAAYGMDAHGMDRKVAKR
jgi:hypothetical protein